MGKHRNVIHFNVELLRFVVGRVSSFSEVARHEKMTRQAIDSYLKNGSMPPHRMVNIATFLDLTPKEIAMITYPSKCKYCDDTNRTVRNVIEVITQYISRTDNMKKDLESILTITTKGLKNE